MKTIEIDETGGQLVLRPVGSTIARVVNKDDASDVRDALLAVLEETQEQRPSEPEGEAVDGEVDEDVDHVIDDARATVNALLDMGKELLGSSEGQKVKGKLEGLFPKTKRMKKHSA